MDDFLYTGLLFIGWIGQAEFVSVGSIHDIILYELNSSLEIPAHQNTLNILALSLPLSNIRSSLSLSTSLCAPTTQFLMSGGKSTKLKAFTHGHTQRTNREEAVASPSFSFGILFLLGPV